MMARPQHTKGQPGIHATRSARAAQLRKEYSDQWVTPLREPYASEVRR